MRKILKDIQKLLVMVYFNNEICVYMRINMWYH